MTNPLTRLKEAWASVRRARPFIDHTARGWTRYQADGGDRLAAAVTYFGFLSFFPIVALAFSVAGFVVDAYPDAQKQLVTQINSFLPGLADKLDITKIGDAKVATGIVGLVGLLLAGLGWVDALREAIRTIWHHNVEAGNVVTKKLLDIAILVGLGLTLIASVAITGVASSLTTGFLDLLGISNNIGAKVFVRVLGIALAVVADMALFAFLLTRLPRVSTPWRRVAKGTLLGAVGFEVLKVVGSLLVARTTKNPVYGAFAVVVGLLIWINLVSRFTLYVAAWTVTAPYDTDVAPSGTSSEEMAEKADIPTEYADDDPDDPPTTSGKGAPSRLANAVRGKTPPQDEPTGAEAEQPDGEPTGEAAERAHVTGGSAAESAEHNEQEPVPVGVPTAGGNPPHASPESVRTADRVGRGAALVSAAGAAVLGARALRRRS